MSGGNGVTVVRFTHSAMVDEYRERERLLQRRFGYRVHLVNPPSGYNGGKLLRMEPDPELGTHAVRTYGRAHHPILFWFSPREVWRILREHQPQVVDLHEEPYSLSVAAALPLIRRAVPDARICVYTAQNIDKRYAPPFRQLESHALRTCQTLYPCSTEAGDVMRAKGFEGNVRVIPLGVSLEPPRTVADTVTRVGYVGRLESYKGTEVALDAFARSSLASSATLEFLGDGPQRDQLALRARASGIAGNVSFPGPVGQDEALRRIRAYDILMIPSLTTATWKEQFGRVAAQALAAGTAVVASDSGSLREVVGSAGELILEGDVAGFAAALDRLAADRGYRSRLSIDGQRRAAERFSWDRVAEQVDEMYTELLAHKR